MPNKVCGKQASTYMPSEPCVDGRRAGAGKIYFRSVGVVAEARASGVVSRVDKQHVFSVRTHGTCVTRDGRTQLLMDHAGVNLDDALAKIVLLEQASAREEGAAKTYAGLMALFRNMRSLCAAGYAHHDISPKNVMTSDGSRYVMIDMGNLVRLDDVFSPRNRYLTATYPYNQTEYKLFAAFSSKPLATSSKTIADVAANYRAADWINTNGLDEAVRAWDNGSLEAAAKTTDVFAFGVLMQWGAKTLRDAAPSASKKFAHAGRIMAAMNFRSRPQFCGRRSITRA